ncbi:MAG: methylisocitrate lyase, partial [Tatlockia sp.]|nr:methylisocitrate lyase [Tatlockia sp.]
SQAALNVYQTIRNEGSQKSLLDSMQTRNKLYEVLGYEDYEKKLDQLMEVADGQ